MGLIWKYRKSHQRNPPVFELNCFPIIWNITNSMLPSVTTCPNVNVAHLKLDLCIFVHFFASVVYLVALLLQFDFNHYKSNTTSTQTDGLTFATFLWLVLFINQQKSLSSLTVSFIKSWKKVRNILLVISNFPHITIYPLECTFAPWLASANGRFA